MIFRSSAARCGAILAVLLTGTAAGAATPGADGPDMGAYVSPAVGPVESQYVRTALDELPLPLKQLVMRTSPMQFHLAIVDGGQLTAHYNRPDDAGSLTALPPDPLPGDDYPFAQPGIYGNCGFPGVPFPGCYSGSGAYRRVYTAPVKPEAVSVQNYNGIPGWQEVVSNWGYWNSGTVTAPCTNGFMRRDATHSDGGYSYLGGWSPTPEADGGTIDAGLQDDWKLSAASHDDYALFLKVSGEKTFVKSTNPSYPAAPRRIACGQSANLLYWVMPYEIGGVVAKALDKPQCIIPGQNEGDATNPACASYAFFAAYMGSPSVDSSYIGAIMWIAPSGAYGGWGGSIPIHTYWEGKRNVLTYAPVVPCGNCVFKWMTSIAQKNTDGFKEDLHDGSRFAGTWANRAIAPWAVTPGLTLKVPVSAPLTANLIRCSEYPIWATPYDAGNRDCRNSPLLRGLASSIVVTGFSLTGEADAISLTH